MKRPAVFVDRDGTINEQMGYINHPSRFVILPGVPEGIRLLNENNFLVIVVSNQSGVARGYFPIDLVYEVHDIMRATLKEKKATIDGVFFCPHHTQGVVPEYRLACGCRKPKPGLVEQACAAFDIDMAKAYVVGDRFSDMELAYRLSINGVMVKTGYGLGDIAYVMPGKQKPSHIAQDLHHAARWIVERESP